MFIQQWMLQSFKQQFCTFLHLILANNIPDIKYYYFILILQENKKINMFAKA